MHCVSGMTVSFCVCELVAQQIMFQMESISGGSFIIHRHGKNVYALCLVATYYCQDNCMHGQCSEQHKQHHTCTMFVRMTTIPCIITAAGSPLLVFHHLHHWQGNCMHAQCGSKVSHKKQGTDDRHVGQNDQKTIYHCSWQAIHILFITFNLPGRAKVMSYSGVPADVEKTDPIHTVSIHAYSHVAIYTQCPKEVTLHFIERSSSDCPFQTSTHHFLIHKIMSFIIKQGVTLICRMSYMSSLADSPWSELMM